MTICHIHLGWSLCSDILLVMKKMTQSIHHQNLAALSNLAVRVAECVNWWLRGRWGHDLATCNVLNVGTQEIMKTRQAQSFLHMPVKASWLVHMPVGKGVEVPAQNFGPGQRRRSTARAPRWRRTTKVRKGRENIRIERIRRRRRRREMMMRTHQILKCPPSQSSLVERFCEERTFTHFNLLAGYWLD